MKKIYLLFIFLGLIKIFPQKQLTEKQIDSVRRTIRPSFNNEELIQLMQLYYQAKEINYTKGKINTLNRMASIEWGFSNYDKAFNYLKELKELSKSIGDYKSYIIGLCTESSIYSSDKNYDYAHRILNDAFKYVDKIENIEERRKTKIAIYSNKSFVFFNSKSPTNSYSDSIISLSKKHYSEALLIKDEVFKNQNIFTSVLFIAVCYIKKDQINYAKKYLDICKKQIKKQNPGGFGMAEYYDALGDFEYKNKKNNKNYLDSSLVNYNRAIRESINSDYTGLLKNLYPKVAKIYRDKKDVSNQNKFLEKTNSIKDSLESKQDIGLNTVKKSIYEIKNHNDMQIQENKKLIFYIPFIIFVLSVLLYINFNLRKKKKLVKSNVEKLDNKSKNIIEKKDSAHKPPTSYFINLLQDDDENFYLEFLENYPYFVEKLLNINPTLKSSDIEFCAYIKLNLDTKQIAQYKKMSVRAVEGKKYRIRKKLDIMPDDNMYIWISKL